MGDAIDELARVGLIDSFLMYRAPTRAQVLLFDKLVYPYVDPEDVFCSIEDVEAVEELKHRDIIVGVTFTRSEKPSFNHQDRIVHLPGDHPRFTSADEVRRLVREVHGIDAVPVSRTSSDWLWDRGDDVPRADAMQIALSTVPVPLDEVPWSRILAFRDDPDARHSLLGLRRFLTSMVREERTEVEIREEIEYLTHEYRRHLEHHQVKWRTGTLESVLQIGAELLESALFLSPSRALSALFSVRHRRVALEQAKRDAPGREIAYLVRIGEVLG